MARLYSNENFPLPVVEELRNLGHDVVTSSESARAGQGIPDDQVLQFAVETSRIVVTFNRLHFIRLHSHYPNHFGIIVCTYDPDFKALAGRIDQELKSKLDFAKQLARINRPGK